LTALHVGRIDQLEIYPNLWAGVGWCAAAPGLRSSAATRKSPNLISEYTRLGFDEFILSGLPAPGGSVLVRRRCASDPEQKGGGFEARFMCCVAVS